MQAAPEVKSEPVTATVATAAPPQQEAVASSVEDKRAEVRDAALQKVDQIEKEFQVLKDEYFAGKVGAIQNELRLVESGKHDQYIAKEQQLIAKQKLAVETATRERAYQIRQAQLVYEADVALAERDLDLDRKHLKKKMVESLQQRLEELEEEKKTFSMVDLNAKKAVDDGYAGQPKKKKAKADAPIVTAPDGRRKRLNPPHVSYSLRDMDIYNDLHLLKRPNLARSQLEQILYDVYATSDGIVYHDKQFVAGHPVIVGDRNFKPLYGGVIETISPLVVVVKPSAGGASVTIELAKLRDGELSLLRP